MESRNPVVHGLATAPGDGCVITEEWRGRTVVISAAGVLDMLTSPLLEMSVTSAAGEDPSAIIVDLTDVDFLASAGMSVLVAARERARPHIGFGVVANGPATSRPLKLVGLADLIGLYATCDDALLALGE